MNEFFDEGHKVSSADYENDTHSTQNSYSHNISMFFFVFVSMESL